MGQVWGRIGSRFLLIDQSRGCMDCPATVRAVRQMSSQWPGAVAKLIEDPVNPLGGKVARAAAVSPLIEAGNVYLPHPHSAPWVAAFLEECAAFPNAAHDDQVDAMTQALIWWIGREEQYLITYSEPVRISVY